MSNSLEQDLKILKSYIYDAYIVYKDFINIIQVYLRTCVVLDYLEWMNVRNKKIWES